MSEIAVLDLTDAHVDYIYEHLRPEDRLEAYYSGTADPAIAKAQLAKATCRQCVTVDGEPAAMRGYTLEDDCVLAWFIATPLADRFPLTLHRMSCEFLRALRRSGDHRPIRTGVWEGYAKSLRWVERLGFHETGKYYGEPPNRVLVMEMHDHPRSR